MEPYPVGAVVRYEGSWGLLEGEYVITAHEPLADALWNKAEKAQLEKCQVNLAEEYPDGICYEIWKRGVLRKFGNRGYSFSRVRRKSLAPTGEHEEAPGR